MWMNQAVWYGYLMCGIDLHMLHTYRIPPRTQWLPHSTQVPGTCLLLPGVPVLHTPNYNLHRDRKLGGNNPPPDSQK
jgi:hypothetical protein